MSQTTFEDFVKAFDGKVKVLAIKYESEFSTGGIEAFGYKGKELLPILVKINSTHSYGDSAGQENPTIDNVMMDIECNNGDGCDCIMSMETGGVVLTLTNEENFDLEDDDYEGCDE